MATQTNPATGNCWERGKLSAEGFRFIKGFEGYAEREYRDSGGYRTICYGVTYHGEQDIFNMLKQLEPVPEKTGATLSYELKNQRYGEKILPTCKELGISKQYQFDALVSFSYNLGIGVIMDKQSSIYKAIKKNINDKEGITKAFGEYIHAGGKPEPGLIARRKDEADMFFGEKVKNRPITTIRSDGSYGPPLKDNNGNGWLPYKC